MGVKERNLALFVFILVSTLTSALSDELHSCLISNGVQNLTTFSPSPLSNYHKLIYLTMQNLIFAKPTFPKPSAIVLPETKEQLMNTIICCQRGSWTIRIRSGGHSYEGLSYTADTRFVIIDMMNLNRVSINLDSETAWVESGATLGEVYYAISEASGSLGFPAGWCPTVGSGGHFSGGGYGLMTRKYGLAADNIIDAVLVSSDGHILDRKAMGEEVFWAIRGGGGGVWGAIYAWKIRLLPVPKIITAIKLVRNGTMNEVSKLVQKWQFVAPVLEDDFSLAVLVSSKNNGPWLKFFGLYLGPKSMAISITNEAFPELEFKEDECKEMSWIESLMYLAEIESIKEFKDRFSSFDKSPFKVKVDYVKVPIPLEGILGALKMLAKQPNGFIVLNGQGGMMSRIRSDAIPFPHRKGNLFTVDYIIAWDEEDDLRRDEFTDWLLNFYEYMKDFVSKDPRVGYVNYVDLDFGQIDWNNNNMLSNAVEIGRTWGEKYYLSNYDRLVQAKTLIDPRNVFRHPQSIPPLATKGLGQEGFILTDFTAAHAPIPRRFTQVQQVKSRDLKAFKNWPQGDQMLSTVFNSRPMLREALNYGFLDLPLS